MPRRHSFFPPSCFASEIKLRCQNAVVPVCGSSGHRTVWLAGARTRRNYSLMNDIQIVLANSCRTRHAPLPLFSPRPPSLPHPFVTLWPAGVRLSEQARIRYNSFYLVLSIAVWGAFLQSPLNYGSDFGVFSSRLTPSHSSVVSSSFCWSISNVPRVNLSVKAASPLKAAADNTLGVQSVNDCVKRSAIIIYIQNIDAIII